MPRDTGTTSLPRGVKIFTKPGTKFIWVSLNDATGKRVRRSTGETDEAAAVAAALALYEEMQSVSFKQAAVDFFRVRGGGSKPLTDATMHGYKNSLRVTTPFFAHLTLAQINRAIIQGFVADRRKSVKDASVRRDLAFLSSVFTFAQEEYVRVPEANPFVNYSKKRLREVKRETFLTYEQYKCLDDACTEEWQRMMLWVGVCTGMRHGEMRHFRHSWIDWEREEIRLPKEITKGEKARVIPLIPELAVPLQKYCAKLDCDLIFTHWDQVQRQRVMFTTFNNSWRAIRGRAGLKTVRLHDLRHTFASWFLQDGGDIKVLAEILGHTTVKTTERYAHLSTKAIQRAMKERTWHSMSTDGGDR